MLINTLFTFLEENDGVTEVKKILSSDDRERIRRCVIQITTLGDWKHVGILLGLSDSDVKEIEHDNHFIMRNCMLAMFNEWLRKDTSFSTYEEGLRKLSTILDMVGEKVLANQLKQECGKWNNLSFVFFHHDNK